MYKEIILSLPYPVSFVGKDYSYKVVNKAYESYYNTTVENIIGKKVESFFEKGFFEKEIKPNIDKCFSGKEVTYEVSITFQSGDKKTMQMHYTPFYDEDDTLLGLISHGQDITKEKNLEEKLSFNEAYLNNIFQKSPNIAIVTTGEEIDRANDKMLEFTGYSSLYEFKQDHDCICDLFLEGQGLLQADMDGLTWLEYILGNLDLEHKVAMVKESQRYYFKVDTNKIEFDENDRFKIVFTDITENEKLKRRLEFAIEGANDGLFDYDLESDTIYYSPRWKEIIGYKDDEIANEFSEWEIRTEPHDREAAKKDFQAYLEGKTKSYHNLHRMKHKDGSWRYILARGKFCGDKKRVVGTHTDLTSLITMEKELEYAKRYLENIFDINPNITFITNGEELLKANGKFLEFVEFDSVESFKEKYDCICDMFEDQNGYVTKYMGDQNWVEYICDNKEKENRALIIKHQKEYIFEITIVELYENYLVSFYDVSQIIEKDKLLITQSRSAAMGDMISMIAHQWRQPLAVLSMIANNMLADYELGIATLDEFESCSKSIQEQIKYLSKTIDDFRDFFKPTSEKEKIEIEQLLETTIEFMYKSLENSNIEVIKNFEKVGSVDIYANELSHVLINLIKNAKEILVEKQKKTKSITISTYRKQNKVYISVEDTGGGIDNSILNRVFEPYFTTKQQLNGTGLGLYMSKMIIEDHFKGAISVSNTKNGAKFLIEILDTAY